MSKHRARIATPAIDNDTVTPSLLEQKKEERHWPAPLNRVKFADKTVIAGVGVGERLGVTDKEALSDGEKLIVTDVDIEGETEIEGDREGETVWELEILGDAVTEGVNRLSE